jgi:hypothetical protein
MVSKSSKYEAHHYVIIAKARRFSPAFTAGIARNLGRRYTRKERRMAESLKNTRFFSGYPARTAGTHFAFLPEVAGDRICPQLQSAQDGHRVVPPSGTTGR